MMHYSLINAAEAKKKKKEFNFFRGYSYNAFLKLSEIKGKNII